MCRTGGGDGTMRSGSRLYLVRTRRQVGPGWKSSRARLQAFQTRSLSSSVTLIFQVPYFVSTAICVTTVSPDSRWGIPQAAAFELVTGAFVNAERRRDDPADFNPASGGADREGSGTLQRCALNLKRPYWCRRIAGRHHAPKRSRFNAIRCSRTPVPAHPVRLACPASCHDGCMIRDGSETSSRVPRD
jgi:hypothetical protein